MKKRVVVIAMVMVVMCLFSACQKVSPTTSSNTSTEEIKEEVKSSHNYDEWTSEDGTVVFFKSKSEQEYVNYLAKLLTDESVEIIDIREQGRTYSTACSQYMITYTYVSK